MPTTAERIVEVLPEGDTCAWITLDDTLTRVVDFRPLHALPSHQGLRLRDLQRRPGITPDGTHVIWPGGTFLDVPSILHAPVGPLPIQLLAVLPSSRRYRPLAALLRHQDPPSTSYLDVRPESVLRARLGISAAELQRIVERHTPVPPELVLARLSDAVLALQAILPGDALPALVRQPWPHARAHFPGRATSPSALECLGCGRIDLIDGPLSALLLPPAPVPSAL